MFTCRVETSTVGSERDRFPLVFGHEGHRLTRLLQQGDETHRRIRPAPVQSGERRRRACVDCAGVAPDEHLQSVRRDVGTCCACGAEPADAHERVHPAAAGRDRTIQVISFRFPLADDVEVVGERIHHEPLCVARAVVVDEVVRRYRGECRRDRRLLRADDRFVDAIDTHRGPPGVVVANISKVDIASAIRSWSDRHVFPIDCGGAGQRVSSQPCARTADSVDPRLVTRIVVDPEHAGIRAALRQSRNLVQKSWKLRHFDPAAERNGVRKRLSDQQRGDDRPST